MDDYPITTRNPLIHPERVNVFTFARIGADQLPLRFAKDIAWVAECETKFDYSHGGKSLTDGSAYGDHSYGYLSCLRSAVEDAARQAAFYSVTRESSLVMTCRATVRLTAVLVDSEQDHYGGKQYSAVPRVWYRDFDGIEQAIARFRKDGEMPGPTFVSEMRDREPLSDVVWSSAFSAEENERALAEFRRRVTEFVRAPEATPA